MTTEPLYFGDEGRPLFGWLHGVAGPARLGLVVCNPFGYEAICAHRALRHFAISAAAAGVPALRFDYDGTGDSAGGDNDADRVGCWIASIGQACDALRRYAGVERVCLLGLRLGALLAARAALGRDDVDGLIAIAPVVSGKAYTRELRALQGALGLVDAPAASAGDEALGFQLSVETQAALVEQDLLKLDRAPAPSVLVIDRSDLPGAERWTRHLQGQGVKVERQVLPGYVEMMLDADKTIVPAQMVAAATTWLTARRAAGGGAAQRIADAAAGFGAVLERAVRLGEHGLFAITSEPARVPRSRLGLVLLNSGGIHHVGPNRLWVRLARAWAARGHTVARVDLSGVGDSPTWPEAPEMDIYTEYAADDVAAVVEWMRRQRGVEEVHLLGLCSGAYHAYKAAAAGNPIEGVVSINPLVFFWQRGKSAAVAQNTAEGSRYLRAMRDPARWLKFVSGKVHYRTLARTLSRRALGVAAGLGRELRRRAGMSLENDLAAELRTIVRARIALRFVFATTDPGLQILRTDGGNTVDELCARGALGIELIDGADHTFTARWAQDALVRVLEGYFG